MVAAVGCANADETHWDRLVRATKPGGLYQHWVLLRLYRLVRRGSEDSTRSIRRPGGGWEFSMKILTNILVKWFRCVVTMGSGCDHYDILT